MPKSDFDQQASERVVKIKKDRTTEKSSGLWGTTPDERRGLDILKDDDGQLYLVRTSKDGWAQAYVLSGANGQLKAALMENLTLKVEKLEPAED